jgi:hypothetical protein
MWKFFELFEKDLNLADYCDTRQNERIVRSILNDMKKKLNTDSPWDSNIPNVGELYDALLWKTESKIFTEFQTAFTANGFSKLFSEIMNEIYPDQTQYTEEQIPGLHNIQDEIARERKESHALRNIIMLSLLLGTIGFIIDATRFEFAGSEKIFVSNIHIGGINIPSGVFIGLGLTIIGVGLWIMKKKNSSTSIHPTELPNIPIMRNY